MLAAGENQARTSGLPEADSSKPLPAAKPVKAPSEGQLSMARERVRLEEQPLPKNLDSFDTAQGGLLFLLNFLKREDVQSLINQQQSENDFTSGWGWLFRLGQELTLDEGDPVTAFLALQLGFKSSDQLNTLPPLPSREHLLDLAWQLYDRAGLWRPDLLRLNARVYYTPSHVDLYAPLNSVRLPIRLAGLDLNPGWLPWLGRVVTFHYEGRRRGPSAD